MSDSRAVPRPTGFTEQESCLVCDAPTTTIIGTLKPGQAALCLACAFAIDMDRQRVEAESATP